MQLPSSQLQQFLALSSSLLLLLLLSTFPQGVAGASPPAPPCICTLASTCDTTTCSISVQTTIDLSDGLMIADVAVLSSATQVTLQLCGAISAGAGGPMRSGTLTRCTFYNQVNLVIEGCPNDETAATTSPVTLLINGTSLSEASIIFNGVLPRGSAIYLDQIRIFSSTATRSSLLPVSDAVNDVSTPQELMKSPIVAGIVLNAVSMTLCSVRIRAVTLQLNCIAPQVAVGFWLFNTSIQYSTVTIADNPSVNLNVMGATNVSYLTSAFGFIVTGSFNLSTKSALIVLRNSFFIGTQSLYARCYFVAFFANFQSTPQTGLYISPWSEVTISSNDFNVRSKCFILHHIVFNHSVTLASGSQLLLYRNNPSNRQKVNVSWGHSILFAGPNVTLLENCLLQIASHYFAVSLFVPWKSDYGGFYYHIAFGRAVPTNNTNVTDYSNYSSFGALQQLATLNIATGAFLSITRNVLFTTFPVTPLVMPSPPMQSIILFGAVTVTSRGGVDLRGGLLIGDNYFASFPLSNPLRLAYFITVAPGQLFQVLGSSFMSIVRTRIDVGGYTGSLTPMLSMFAGPTARFFRDDPLNTGVRTLWSCNCLYFGSGNPPTVLPQNPTTTQCISSYPFESSVYGDSCLSCTRETFCYAPGIKDILVPRNVSGSLPTCTCTCYHGFQEMTDTQQSCLPPYKFTRTQTITNGTKPVTLTLTSSDTVREKTASRTPTLTVTETESSQVSATVGTETATQSITPTNTLTLTESDSPCENFTDFGWTPIRTTFPLGDYDPVAHLISGNVTYQFMYDHLLQTNVSVTPPLRNYPEGFFTTKLPPIYYGWQLVYQKPNWNSPDFNMSYEFDKHASALNNDNYEPNVTVSWSMNITRDIQFTPVEMALIFSINLDQVRYNQFFNMTVAVDITITNAVCKLNPWNFRVFVNIIPNPVFLERPTGDVTTATAALSILNPNFVGAAASQRANLMIGVVQCRSPSLVSTASLTGWNFGSSKGAYARGASAGNMILLGAVCAGWVIAAGGFAAAAHVRFFFRAFHHATESLHIPSVFLGVMIVYFQPTLSSSVSLIMSPVDFVDIPLGVSSFCICICIFILVHIVVLTTRENQVLVKDPARPVTFATPLLRSLAFFFWPEEHYINKGEEDYPGTLFYRSGQNMPEPGWWKHRMYYFFNEYKPNLAAFCLVDLWFSLIVGILYGLTPYRVEYCTAQNAVLIAGFTVQIAAAAYFQPFRWLHMIIAYIVMAVIGLAGSISMMIGQQMRNNVALDVACGFTFFYAIAALIKVLMDFALTVASMPRSSEKALSLVARDQPTMDEREMEPAVVYRPPTVKKVEEPEEPLLELPPTLPEPEPKPIIEEDDWDPTMLSGYQNPLAQEYGDRSLEASAPSLKKKGRGKKHHQIFQQEEDEEEEPPQLQINEEDDPLNLDVDDDKEDDDEDDL